jgi:hypothetical protein
MLLLRSDKRFRPTVVDFRCTGVSVATPLYRIVIVEPSHGGYVLLTVEQNNNHLVIRSICMRGAQVRLDRNSDTATVYDLAFVLPYRRTRTQFADLDEAQVFKRERTDGSAGYGIVLRYRKHSDIRFDCMSREGAMRALRAINKFLNLEE